MSREAHLTYHVHRPCEGATGGGLVGGAAGGADNGRQRKPPPWKAAPQPLCGAPRMSK
jgi:hypothetical protein